MMNILSLGGGVQSSTMGLMATHGEILPMPDAAIFADTQAEPASVYTWLTWLEQHLAFPVYRVTRGSMTAEMLRIRDHQSIEGRTWAKSLIPAFIRNPNGTQGIMGRSCTADYKIAPIMKKVKELAGIKRNEEDIRVIQWIGISLDEAHRMKPSQKTWSKHRWPLIEKGMRRSDCLQWMTKNGYPTPPRSACIYCPYHSDAEWRRLRDEEPEEFGKAVKFEHDLQDVKARTGNLAGVPFLHASRVPLRDVDLRTASGHGQTDMFGNECEGICGV